MLRWIPEKVLHLTLAFLIGIWLSAFAFAFALEGTRWNPKEILMPTITYYQNVCHDQMIPDSTFSDSQPVAY